MDIPRTNIKLAKEHLPLGLAGVYVLGFIVVGIHLAGYGASTLDLIKVQYLAAGFWFCGLSGIYFGFLRLLRIAVKAMERTIQRPSFRPESGTGELLFSIFSNVFIVCVVILPVWVMHRLPHWGEFGNRFDLVWQYVRFSIPFLISLGILDFALHLTDWFKMRVFKEHYFGDAWIPVWVSSYFLILGVSINCVLSFSTLTYRTISFSLGGGQPRQVIFWLGKQATPSDSVLERSDPNSGYSIPYELLVENEASLVVISPKDNQRAIELDRKTVSAVVILGKRPRSAPAHFERRVIEGNPRP